MALSAAAVHKPILPSLALKKPCLAAFSITLAISVHLFEFEARCVIRPITQAHNELAAGAAPGFLHLLEIMVVPLSIRER